MNNPLASRVGYSLAFLSNFDVINIEKFHVGLDAMSQNITWSVSIEEQFYLFWPLIFFVLPKRNWIYAISLVIIGSIIFRVMNRNDVTVLYFHTLSVLVDLGIGGLAALLIKFNQRIRSFFENSGTGMHLTFFILAFSLLFWKNTLFATGYGAAFGRIFIALSTALVIAAQAMTKRKSILNLGNLSFPSRCGKYTYGSIYCTQLHSPCWILLFGYFICHIIAFYRCFQSPPVPFC